MTSTIEPRWRRPGSTAAPYARRKPSGARSWVPLKLGSPSSRASACLIGFSGCMPKPETTSEQIAGRQRVERRADLAVDEGVVAIEHLREPPPLLFRHVAERPRLRIAQVVVADGVEPLVPERASKRGLHLRGKVVHRAAVEAIARAAPTTPATCRAGTPSHAPAAASEPGVQAPRTPSRAPAGCRGGDAAAIELGDRSDELVEPIADDEAVDRSSAGYVSGQRTMPTRRPESTRIDQSGRARQVVADVRLGRGRTRAARARGRNSGRAADRPRAVSFRA